MPTSKDWDFNKLPADIHDVVIALYVKRDWLSLMLIHNEYRLSAVNYCCNEKAMQNHYGKAIDKGLIKQSN